MALGTESRTASQDKAAAMGRPACWAEWRQRHNSLARVMLQLKVQETALINKAGSRTPAGSAALGWLEGTDQKKTGSH